TVDMLPLAVAQLRDYGTHCRNCAMNTSLESGLTAESLQRGHFGVVRAGAVEHTDTTGAPNRQLFSAPLAMRSGHAIRRDRSHHEARIYHSHPLVTEPDTVHFWWPNVVNQHVGLLHEALKEQHAIG